MLVFENAPATFDVPVIQSTAFQNITNLHVLRVYDRDFAQDQIRHQSIEDHTMPAGSSLQVATRQAGTSTLYVEAGTIDFDVGPAVGLITGKDERAGTADFVREEDKDRRLYRIQAPDGAHSVLRFNQQPEPMTFQFHATAVRYMEWYDTDVSCLGTEWCPEGGGPEISRFPSVAGYNITSEKHSYETLTGIESMDGGGVVSYAVLGGRSPTFTVNEGLLRLPLATALDPCEGCAAPANQTLTATGNLTLANLQLGPDGELTASLGGDFQSARFDEAPIDPRLLTGIGLAGGAVMAAGAAVALKVLLGALFTKLREGVLEQPRRRRIYEAILANPGVGVRELARLTDLSHGVVNHHLGFLLRHDKVVQRNKGQNVHFFENHGKFDAIWSHVAALKKGEGRLLHAWLQNHSNATQMDVVAGMAEYGWSRAATQRALNRLVDAGVVSSSRQGRFKHFHAIAVSLPEARRVTTPSSQMPGRA